MSGPVAQKQGDKLLYDMQVMYYIVKRENEHHTPVTRSSVESQTTFEDEKGKWGRDKARFDAAFDALIKGGYVKEKAERVKTGIFKSEHALEAVKLPEKIEEEKPSMREEIDKVRKSYPYGRR